MAETIVAQLADPQMRELIEDLRAIGLRLEEDGPPPGEGVLSGRTLVLTGTLPDLTREEATERITGVVTAEALASGTPVVGTPVGATPELLLPLDPRLVARSAAPSDIAAAAIAETVPFTGAELRAGGRRYAEPWYSWDAVMPGWIDALRRRSRTHAPGEASAGG